jgi:hypothetical protein
MKKYVLWENPTRRRGRCSTIFLLDMEFMSRQSDTHCGVSMDTVATMDTTRSSISFVLLQYPTLYSPIEQYSIQ